jgi:hypothetical protein
MRFLACFALLTLLLPGPLFAVDPNLDPTRGGDFDTTPRPFSPEPTIPASPAVGGEDIGTAYPIPTIPFADTGNTCGYLNDYDEACPYTGSLSPDVVYSYTPANDIFVDVDLCSSLYDTKVFVYENTAGNLVACNDDYCGSTGFQSELALLPMTAGNTYYIVVDGYGNDCGEYDLLISEWIVEQVECPAGAYLEGEPDCHENYDDQYNSGCGGHPEPVFLPLTGTPDGSRFSVCGTGGTYLYNGLNYRDTDWYELTVTTAETISFEGAANFPVSIALIDGNAGCAGYEILDFQSAGSFPDYATITWDCLPGTYWFWVGTSEFSGIPCGSEYVFHVDGYTTGPIAVEPASWAGIKGLYR